MAIAAVQTVVTTTKETVTQTDLEAASQPWTNSPLITKSRPRKVWPAFLFPRRRRGPIALGIVSSCDPDVVLSRRARFEQPHHRPNQHHGEKSRNEPCHCHNEQNSLHVYQRQELSTIFVVVDNQKTDLSRRLADRSTIFSVPDPIRKTAFRSAGPRILRTCGPLSPRDTLRPVARASLPELFFRRLGVNFSFPVALAVLTRAGFKSHCAPATFSGT